MVKLLKLVLKIVSISILAVGLFFIVMRIYKDDSKTMTYPEMEDIFIVLVFFMTLICYLVITIKLLYRLK